MKAKALSFSFILMLIAGAVVLPASASVPDGITQEIRKTSGAGVTVESGAVRLSVSSGRQERFLIYSITGQLIKTVDVAPGGEERVDLRCGCYIIKCSFWSKKVMVR